jgi:hypothetical protein
LGDVSGVEWSPRRFVDLWALAAKIGNRSETPGLCQITQSSFSCHSAPQRLKSSAIDPE